MWYRWRERRRRKKKRKRRRRKKKYKKVGKSFLVKVVGRNEWTGEGGEKVAVTTKVDSSSEEEVDSSSYPQESLEAEDSEYVYSSEEEEPAAVPSEA